MTCIVIFTDVRLLQRLLVVLKSSDVFCLPVVIVTRATRCSNYRRRSATTCVDQAGRTCRRRLTQQTRTQSTWRHRLTKLRSVGELQRRRTAQAHKLSAMFDGRHRPSCSWPCSRTDCQSGRGTARESRCAGCH